MTSKLQFNTGFNTDAVDAIERLIAFADIVAERIQIALIDRSQSRIKYSS